MHCTTPVRTHYARVPLYQIRAPLRYCIQQELDQRRTTTCSAFLLNDFSCKRLSEGVTNCAIIIALNISLRTFFPHSMLTMSLQLAIEATQGEAGERTLPKMLAITFLALHDDIRS